MAILTEVRFVHEHGALVDTLNALPEVDVTVVRDARTNPDHSVYAIRFEGVGPGAVEPVLEADHTVREVTPMPGFEEQTLLGVEFASDTRLLNPEVTSEGGFVIEAHGSNVTDGLRGWYERWLLPDGEALRRIWQRALDDGFEFEVVELYQPGRADTEFHGVDVVTDQQREALTVAYEGGYFAEPREMSLEELADAIDVSPTAAAGRLNRGMKALIGATLLVDGDGQPVPRN